MSKEHRKYVRQERAKKDLQQTVFFQDADGTGLKGNPSKLATITQKGINPFLKTSCPFCLGYSQLRLFLVSTKKGYDRGTGKCPLCGQGMRLQTIVSMAKWTPEEYANFVFGYRLSGFWQKTKFDTWKKRLKLMGWTERFWNEYKRLRGDAPADPESEQAIDEQWNAYEESFSHD